MSRPRWAHTGSIHIGTMSTTQTFRLKNYELVCGARAVDNGRFLPTLVISSNTWPSRPRTIAVRRDDFATETNAIESAHAQGLAWIADFG
jgi:hypothetical protein